MRNCWCLWVGCLGFELCQTVSVGTREAHLDAKDEAQAAQQALFSMTQGVAPDLRVALGWEPKTWTCPSQAQSWHVGSGRHGNSGGEFGRSSLRDRLSVGRQTW